MSRIRTRRRVALAAAGLVVALAGATACGAQSAGSAEPDSGEAAGGTATPTAEPALELADDRHGAAPSEEIVVKVLGNDNVTLGDGTGGNVQMVLDDADFSIAVSSAPRHGTATIDGNTVVYTAAEGYSGEDQFLYRVDLDAGQGVSETAVVRINVAKQ